MKKYLGFFRIRFNTCIRYRAAALSGVVTHFAWGAMTIMLYRAFYKADPAAFPMTLGQVTSYMWLRQAFLTLFASFSGYDGEIFESIKSGGVAYELARPVDVYSMWFVKNLSGRVSNAALRCFPIIAVSALLPAPYCLLPPPDAAAFFGFLVSVILGALLLCAFVTLTCAAAFYTLESSGVRFTALFLVDFFGGDYVPLPFFPDSIKKAAELTPFASMMNVPYRIYCGDLAGADIAARIALQFFWLAAMVIIGRIGVNRALRRTVIQGG